VDLRQFWAQPTAQRTHTVSHTTAQSQLSSSHTASPASPGDLLNSSVMSASDSAFGTPTATNTTTAHRNVGHKGRRESVDVRLDNTLSQGGDWSSEAAAVAVARVSETVHVCVCACVRALCMFCAPTHNRPHKHPPSHHTNRQHSTVASASL